MLELQRNFCALLWQTAILEGVRKLIGLAYAQQKLRLRDELLRLHILFLRRDCERREVHICSDVLFSGSFIWVVAHRVLTNRLQRSAMPSCKLLLAVVAVVDDHRESAFQRRRCAHMHLRLKRNLNALPRLGMNRIAIEKFEFLG